MLHELREFSPSPIISREYERRRYFNWFVVGSGVAAKMEEAASVSLDPYFVPDGWFSDVDDGSSPPAAKKKKLSLSLSKKNRTVKTNGGNNFY